MYEIPGSKELRQYRIKLGLTQTELAQRAGVSQSLIARIEKGDVDPRVSTLTKIINVLKESEKGVRVLAKDIMKHPVITIAPETTLKEASEIMQKNKISQLPVFKDGVQLGSISEDKIVHMLATGKSIKEMTPLKIKEIMDNGFPVVSAATELSTLSRLAESNPAVLVIEKEKVVGIITKSDVVKLVRGLK